MRPIYKYCNGCKKTRIIMRPICGYCNGCKTNNYYETYMRLKYWLWHLLLLKHKKRKKKKNHREEKMQTNERTYLQALTLSFHFYLSLLPSCFCFLFQTFFPNIFFFSSRRKEKKTIEKKKKYKEGREFTFKLLFCLLTFDSYFCPLIFAFSIQVHSPWHLLLFKQKEKKNTKKKNHRKKKNAEKRRSLHFFSRFCI